MTEDFRQRATAGEALEHWYQVKSKLNPKIARLRLGKLDASVGDTVMNTLADGIVNLTWLFDEVGQANLCSITIIIIGLAGLWIVDDAVRNVAPDLISEDRQLQERDHTRNSTLV